MKIILASTSPRRKELLEQLLKKYNMTFDIIGSDKSEDYLKETINDPKTLVEELSKMKARDVFDNIKDNYNELVIIGGDTLISFNNKILGKPNTKEKAYETLKELQNKINEVYTGITVILKQNNNIIEKTISNCSKVYMKPMTDEDINWYIQTEEPLDKAGAYAIQGIGNKFIDKYEGDYNSIIGLNTTALEHILIELNIIK